MAAWITDPSSFQPDPESARSSPDPNDIAAANQAFEYEVLAAYEDHLDASTRLVRELRDRLRVLDRAYQGESSTPTWERVGLLAGIERLLEATRKVVERLESACCNDEGET
jgi:hypothetical protein